MSEKIRIGHTQIFSISSYKWGYGLEKSSQQTQIRRLRLWNRMIKMGNGRITKIIFNWEYDLGLNNWYNSNSIEQILTECSLQQNYEKKFV